MTAQVTARTPVREVSPSQRVGPAARGRALREIAPVVAVLAIAVAATPLLLGSAGLMDTSITIATFAIMAISLGIAYGLGDMLSLAQATFGAVGAYATAIATTSWGVSPWLSLILAIALPAAISYGMARLIVRLSPLALALATLAFAELFELAVNEGGDLTGGYIGIGAIPALPLPNPAVSAHVLGWVLVALAMLVALRLRASNPGRALLAIGTDSVLAKSVGIQVNSHLAATFSLAGGIAGVAGWFYAHTRGYLAPNSLSLDISFMIAIAVIVGGRRTILGPVVGTILIVLLRDHVPGETSHGMFYGAGLVAALLLFPEGVTGESWAARWRRWRSRSSSDRLVRTLGARKEGKA